MKPDYTNVYDLWEQGPHAWPGGYALEFFPVNESGDGGSVVLCFDCAMLALGDPDESGDGLNAGINAEVNEDGQYYGGVSCDQCRQWVIEPACPECGDELADRPRLYADNVDAFMLCRSCSAKLVCGDLAKRLPGIGIEVSPGRNGDFHHHRAPWYAPAGTVYRYAR